jgi:hypothetical protein
MLNLNALMQVNPLVPVAVAVMVMAVGMVWYSVQVFGKKWMSDVGLNTEDMKKAPAIGYVVSIVASLVLGAFLDYFATRLNLHTWQGGAILGAKMWLAFVVTSMAMNYVFAQRPRRLFLIDAGYQLVVFVLAGVIAVLL